MKTSVNMTIITTEKHNKSSNLKGVNLCGTRVTTDTCCLLRRPSEQMTSRVLSAIRMHTSFRNHLVLTFCHITCNREKTKCRRDETGEQRVMLDSSLFPPETQEDLHLDYSDDYAYSCNCHQIRTFGTPGNTFILLMSFRTNDTSTVLIFTCFSVKRSVQKSLLKPRRLVFFNMTTALWIWTQPIGLDKLHTTSKV